MKIILDSLYIYIISFSIYFIFLTLKSLNNNKYNILQKYSKTSLKKNLCLIIYTHNNKDKLKRMLECLKIQDYSQENTSVFVILDNCSDGSEKIPFAPNVKKFIINNQCVVGKKQAISILIEKIHAYSVIDSFVFLDINRYIEEDFLSSVNSSLDDHEIVTGATILFGESLNIRHKIKAAYQKYRMNFLERARACANLYSVIDSDVCAIKRNLVEKIGLPDFENLEMDLEYSLLLAGDNVKFAFNPNIKTYCEVHDFRIRIPRLSKRFGLFLSNIRSLFSVNIKFSEYTLFQLAPNIVFVLLCYGTLVSISLKDVYVADFSVLFYSFCFLILSFALSLFNSKMRAREVLFLSLYPIYSLFHFIKHFFLWRFFRRCFGKKSKSNIPDEKFEVCVEVTDGKGVAPCRLILINECGMAKVNFIFKNKRIVTNSHLRTFDAIEELIKKLADYGFTLKICQACSNFSSNYDGSTNLIKGFCNSQFQVSPQGELPVVIWGTCKGFLPKVNVKNYK